MNSSSSDFMKTLGIYLFGQAKKFSLKFKKAPTMKELMMVYYSEAKSAGLTGKKVAWITSGGPGGTADRHGCHSDLSRKPRRHDRRVQDGRRAL